MWWGRASTFRFDRIFKNNYVKKLRDKSVVQKTGSHVLEPEFSQYMLLNKRGLKLSTVELLNFFHFPMFFSYYYIHCKITSVHNHYTNKIINIKQNISDNYYYNSFPQFIFPEFLNLKLLWYKTFPLFSSVSKPAK